MQKTACIPILSDEVSDLFWIKLSDLRDTTRHVMADVAFDERQLKVPAIRLPCEGKPVLWGITYRLVMQFIELLDHRDSGAATLGGCAALSEFIPLDVR
jgi:hypothetical protein